MATTNKAGDFIRCENCFPYVTCTWSVTCADRRNIGVSRMNDGGKKLVHNDLSLFSNAFVDDGRVLCVLI